MSAKSAGVATSDRRITDQPPEVPDDLLGGLLFQPHLAQMPSDGQAMARLQLT
jgi:hypothetical protein